MLELNKIYNMGCLEGMSHIEDRSIDLVVTSCPYDTMREYGGAISNWNWGVFCDTVKELYRVMKEGGVVVWVVGDATVNGSETCTSFKQALYFAECGFRLHDTMIYAKNNPTPNSGKRYQQCFEYMFVFSKGAPKTANILKEPRRNKYNDKRTYRKKTFNRGHDGVFDEKKDFKIDWNSLVPRRNIWFYSVGLNGSSKDRIAFRHPAIFPEKLAEDHILSWSKEGDLVLDPFVGSGTTAKVAKEMKRNYIGFDVSEEYCKIAEERIKLSTAN